MWMQIIDVYWVSYWCSYWGHLGLGLFSKVFGAMVRIGCIALCLSRIFGAWWLDMIMVVMEGSSLVAVLAQ